MEKDEAATAINRVINGELDDCERALNRNDIRSAKSELDDAVAKLRRIVHGLR